MTAKLGGWLRVLTFALAGLAVLSLVFVAGYLPARWYRVDQFAFQTDYGEGFVYHQALTIARGESIYQPIDRPPYLVGNYPPLFQWVYSWFTGPEPSIRGLPTGRILVQLCCCLAALIMALITAWRTRRILPSLLAPLIFLASYEVIVWSVNVRVDFMAIAFTMAGLAAFLILPGRKGLIVSALLFVAAGFSRQTAVIAPIACTLVLLINEPRSLGWFLGPLAAVGLFILGGLQWATDGEFLRHLVLYNANRMDWAGWRAVMKNEIWFFYCWLAVPLVWTFFDFARRCARRRAQGLPEGNARCLKRSWGTIEIYGLLAVLSLVSYAKVGAAVNYVLEPLAAVGLLLADFLARQLDRLQDAVDRSLRDEISPTWAKIPKGALAAPILALFLALHAGHLVGYRQYIWVPFSPSAESLRISNQIVRELRRQPGEVFSDEPIYTLLAGKTVWFQPFIMSTLCNEGKWDPAPWRHWMETHYFDLMIVFEGFRSPIRNRFSEPLAEAARAHYHLRGRPLFDRTLGRQYEFWVANEPHDQVSQDSQ